MRSFIPLFITVFTLTPFVFGRLCDAEDYVAKHAGNCFDCPDDETRGFNFGSKGNVVDDYTLFLCRYSGISEQTTDGRPLATHHPRCYYDAAGNISRANDKSDGDCPAQAVRKANCEDQKPDCEDQYERCADGGTECKTQTDQCYFCPKRGAGGFVRVDVNEKEGVLDCIYPGADGKHAGYVDHCVFNSTYGQGIAQYGHAPCGLAPKRPGCIPKQKLQDVELPYLTCAGIKCASDACWTCPKISRTDSAFVGGFANDQFFQCDYSSKYNDVPKFCSYNPVTGMKLESEYFGEVIRSAPGCPASATKDQIICAEDRARAEKALEDEKANAAKGQYLTCPATPSYTPAKSCATKNGCWSCPKVPNTKSATASGLGDWEYFSCYYSPFGGISAKNPGRKCSYNPKSGAIVKKNKTFYPISDAGCPPKAKSLGPCRGNK